MHVLHAFPWLSPHLLHRFACQKTLVEPWLHHSSWKRPQLHPCGILVTSDKTWNIQPFWISHISPGVPLGRRVPINWLWECPLSCPFVHTWLPKNDLNKQNRVTLHCGDDRERESNMYLGAKSASSKPHICGYIWIFGEWKICSDILNMHDGALLIMMITQQDVTWTVDILLIHWNQSWPTS